MIPFDPISLGTLTSTGQVASDDTQIPWAFKLAVSVSGTFVGTYNVEGWDGTAWQVMVSAATTAQIVDIVTPIRKVRVNCTAYTSGSLVCVAMGIDCRD